MKACDAGLKARIFDIRRFSTHDGGGIRTTVFFKGCPLNCAWCHNPEGISPKPRPVWFAGKCILCMGCVQAARFGGVSCTGGSICLDPAAGEDWDALMDECPTGALCWDSRSITLEEAMAEIRRDAPFYVYGGGVTLSGGDPLMQPCFAAGLLERCRTERIHTAVETELHAPGEDMLMVLEHADLIYADLKLMDNAVHRRFAGIGNALILDNFRILLSGKLRERVIVRVPLIPGATATAENINGICRFLYGLYPDVRLELLNYNPLAAAKYPLLGRSYPMGEGLRRFDEKEMQAFRENARAAGISNIVCE